MIQIYSGGMCTAPFCNYAEFCNKKAAAICNKVDAFCNNFLFPFLT